MSQDKQCIRQGYLFMIILFIFYRLQFFSEILSWYSWDNMDSFEKMFYVNNLVYLTREYTNLIFHLTIQTYNIWQNMAYADHVVKIITIKSVIHYCFSAVKRKHNMHVGIFYKCLYIVQMYSMATIWIWLEYIIYNFLLDNEHISSKLTNYLRANVVCVIILKIFFFFFLYPV